MSDPPTFLNRGRLSRMLAAMIVAVGLVWVRTGPVNACTCALLGLPEAIAQSDVAFLGTMVSQGGTERHDDVWETTRVGFDVDRAKDAMPTPVVINARLGNSAGCGLEMAIGEVWLVIAHFHDDRAETNLCSGSTRLDELDAPTRDVVMAALDVAPVPESDEPISGATSIPLGVFLAGGAALLIGIVSLAAFRRTRPA